MTEQTQIDLSEIVIFVICALVENGHNGCRYLDHKFQSVFISVYQRYQAIFEKVNLLVPCIKIQARNTPALINTAFLKCVYNNMGFTPIPRLPSDNHIIFRVTRSQTEQRRDWVPDLTDDQQIALREFSQTFINELNEVK